MEEYNFEEPSFPNEENNNYLLLSDFLNQLSYLIDESFYHRFWIRAEISNIKKQDKSGHYYFELVERDKSGSTNAKINGNCWEKIAEKIIPELENKIEKRLSSGIICDFMCKLKYHPQYGLSVEITDIRAAWTIGEHEKKKNKIRKEISEIGIQFNQKNLVQPKIITKIAILSPSSAAGLGDFISEAKKWQACQVVDIKAYTALFEGDNANESISSALRQIKLDNENNKDKTGNDLYDLVIILRGGGAKSSLAFVDEYKIVFEMLQLEIPTWTAIGHEEDQSLLDEYSSKSFHTPSKAASGIWNVITNEFNEYKNNIESIKTQKDLKCLKILNQIDQKRETIKQSSIKKIDEIINKISFIKKSLMLQDPMSILDKGYVVLFDKNNKIIKKEEDLLNNDIIILKTHYGIFEIKVSEIKNMEK